MGKTRGAGLAGWLGRSAALIGLAAALYGIPGCSSKPADLKSLAVADMAKLVVEPTPVAAPDSPFTDAAGKSHTLTEFKGKVVVVNLWATWCAPCVEEMPTLARLQHDYDGKPLQVVAISLDRPEDKANAELFLSKRPPLIFYTEPTYTLARTFTPPVEGLPTTLLIDAQGRVRAYLGGGADWSGPQARKVIDALIAGA